MKNVIQPLAKSVLIPLELTTIASVADSEIHKKNLRFWNNSTKYVEWRNGGHYENN